MTGQDLYHEALQKSTTQKDLELVLELLSGGPKTGKQLWGGFTSYARQANAQNALLKSKCAEYSQEEKVWRLKRKP